MVLILFIVRLRNNLNRKRRKIIVIILYGIFIMRSYFLNMIFIILGLRKGIVVFDNVLRLYT